jgi:hypothetical protein
MKYQVNKNKNKHQYPFINFVEDNIEEVRAYVHSAICNTPLSTNHLDYRWVKSKMAVHAFVEGLGCGAEHLIQQVESCSYDMLFNGKSKVSIKLSKFSQHPDKRSIHPDDKNEPGWIILKNIQDTSGRQRSPLEEDWDYLLAIDKQDADTGHGLSFGIIHVDEFVKKCEKNPDMFYQSNHQLKVKIYDKDWNWFDTCPIILPEYSDVELERIDIKYRQIQCQNHNVLLKKNNINPNKMLKILKK